MMLGTKNIFMYFCRGDTLCLYFAERLGSLAEIKPWGVNLQPYSKWQTLKMFTYAEVSLHCKGNETAG